MMALIFAFYAVRAAHLTNVQQGLQLKALEEDRNQAQASKVAAWCVGDAGEIPSCRIRNASELPIYGAIACIAASNMPPDSYLHPERYTWWWRFQYSRPHVLPPGATIDVEFDHAGLVDDVEMSSRHASAALYFRDANGRWWRRSVKGKLEEQAIDRDLLDRATVMQDDQWSRINPETTSSDALEAFLGRAGNND